MALSWMRVDGRSTASAALLGQSAAKAAIAAAGLVIAGWRRPARPVVAFPAPAGAGVPVGASVMARRLVGRAAGPHPRRRPAVRPRAS